MITNFQIFRYFLYLGITGFGGPFAFIEYMRRDLVIKKKWMTLEEFKNYFGYAQIAPGPLAFQVAVYFAYFKKGFWAAVLTLIGLVIPSFSIVLIFSIFYKEFNDISYIVWGLYGIGPIIISIIFYSGFNLTRTVFTKDIFQYVLFFSAVAVSIFFKVHILILILSFAFIALTYYTLKEKFKSDKVNSISVLAITAILSAINYVPVVLNQFIDYVNNKLLDIALVFMKAGALTYGSGFVIIGVLRHDVVENFKWLTAKEFIDGIAFGQITPGPVVITSTFIGYMVSGIPGSVVATISVFLPTFIIVLILAQVIEKVKDNFYLKAAIKGANAAAIGAIITTAYFLSKDALIDYWTYGMFLSGIGILFYTKLKPYYLIILSATAGIAIKFFF
ncbi:MAG: chromate efflux transporter [Ignavibacteriota bacterium]|nr:chromate efflux transporter [Ignavibacteriota bacterium]